MPLIVMALLSVAALSLPACGSAAIPPEADTKDTRFVAQEAVPTATPEPTPTPTPLPTTCITVPSEEGTPQEDCFTPNPIIPPKYSKLYDDLDDLAQEAEKRRAPGRRDTSTEVVRVRIEPAAEVPGSRAAIVKWLKQRGIHSQTFSDDHPYGDIEYGAIGAAVPLTLLGPLSQLEAVTYVERPIVPVIPFEVRIEDPELTDAKPDPTAEPTVTPAPSPTTTPTAKPPPTSTGKPSPESTPSPMAEATPSPTPLPMICGQGPHGEVCIVDWGPTPTPKYPALGEFSRHAQEAEEAQEASGPSGAPGQSDVEVPVVFVRINLSSNWDQVMAWIKSQGIPLMERDLLEGIYNRELGIYYYDDIDGKYIHAIFPASLLVPLSQQEGFEFFEHGCTHLLACR